MNTSLPAAALGCPPAEMSIDLAFASALVAEQFPEFAHLPLRPLAEGWDNVMFRLGDSLAVRLPRRDMGAKLILHEHAWLKQLADQLPLPVPAPVRIGLPTASYPWRWSIVPWIAGTTADLAPPDSSQAGPFARFLGALHRPAPADAPANPVRGVPLQHRANSVEGYFQQLATSSALITPALRERWQAALAAPFDAAPTWVHGDLHPQNILVEQGALSGIIDWGDLNAGDRATDLAAIWMLFADPRDRQAVWDAYPAVSPATRQRARGWAIFFGAVLLANGLVNNPQHARVGERTLARINADPDD
jgi:aminoglycoside phosphotransferase (APT) family kinase protein